MQTNIDDCLLVTEPHSELNAGLVVLFASSHAALFDVAEWVSWADTLSDTGLQKRPRLKAEEVIQHSVDVAIAWALLGEWTSRASTWTSGEPAG